MTSLVRLGAVVALTGLAMAPSAGTAPPNQGVLVPGRSLGGISLGDTPAQVRAAWGARYGVCRTCPRTTWYFNSRRFQPQGAGVELRRGRVAAVFTLWQPQGWRSVEGLRLGDSVVRVTAVHGPMTRRECGGYYALTMPGRNVTTAFYVVDQEVWAFGLMHPAVPVCR